MGTADADSFTDAPPAWEPLLWGGPVGVSDSNGIPVSIRPTVRGPQRNPESSAQDDAGTAETETGSSWPEAAPDEARAGTVSTVNTIVPRFLAGFRGSSLVLEKVIFPLGYRKQPFSKLELKRIPPLYSSPRLPGEGVWTGEGMPVTAEGRPAVYRTSYRPSVDRPNAIVHMLLFDMKRISMQMYIGSAEPEAPENASQIEPEKVSRLLVITNAMWKQKHSGDAGAIFRGRVIRDMFPGMATLVVYKDGSVDILEWNDGIPVSLIQDARQLRHLIVKNGKVVRKVVKAGQSTDSEIGLGFLLAEEEEGAPVTTYWGGYYLRKRTGINFDEDWYIATRSAFGIRPDGNLVFAVGHHLSTKDLAKAMVLAGCIRAIHGDANPHNVLGNLYYTDTAGNIVKKAKLSPEQKDYTLGRYVDKTYTSDFFAFYCKKDRKGSRWAEREE
jgi:hypothetical protein